MSPLPPPTPTPLSPAPRPLNPPPPCSPCLPDGGGIWPTLRGDYTGATPCWAEAATPDNCTYTPFTNISVAKNGGVPQAADIDAHAASVAANVAEKIPDAAFSGLLILDFEGWRPAAADNDAVYPEGYTLSKYTQHSRSLVRVSHPDCERRQPTPPPDAPDECPQGRRRR